VKQPEEIDFSACSVFFVYLITFVNDSLYFVQIVWFASGSHVRAV